MTGHLAGSARYGERPQAGSNISVESWREDIWSCITERHPSPVARRRWTELMRGVAVIGVALFLVACAALLYADGLPEQVFWIIVGLAGIGFAGIGAFGALTTR